MSRISFPRPPCYGCDCGASVLCCVDIPGPVYRSRPRSRLRSRLRLPAHRPRRRKVVGSTNQFNLVPHGCVWNATCGPKSKKTAQNSSISSLFVPDSRTERDDIERRRRGCGRFALRRLAAPLTSENARCAVCVSAALEDVGVQVRASGPATAIVGGVGRRQARNVGKAARGTRRAIRALSRRGTPATGAIRAWPAPARSRTRR